MNRWSRISLVVLSLCGLLGLGTAWRVRHQNIPKVEGFAQISRAWSPYGGAWQLSGNTLKNNSDERGAKLLTGEQSWADYAIDADVALLGD